MSILRQILTRTANKILPPVFISSINTRTYHIFYEITKLQQIYQHNLLAIPSVSLNQTCGFKVKGRLRKRCKDCYFVMRQQRLYVICNTHPRHKQMSPVKDERNTWMLSHATQSKIRPW
ncbi:Ribosomal protein L36 [Popillia japonica]|uniref:Ribosomal protein n=1 Tax=Popillia japonica TaxID=7064 RepID=A0AAW1MHR2_POPJA